MLTTHEVTEVPSELRPLVDIACRGDSIVLVTGPTGSGKTRLARYIHDHGSRRGRPFVTVNLASLHEGTFESELFGHERGAFTGAAQRRVGRLESAQGGTVFLDEIGELTPRLQARLLEFLQSRLISPVGSSREIKLDVRVIAATHRDLEAAVSRGEFREDLFHRLRIVPLRMRSLVERADDEFDALVHACLTETCRRAGRSVLRLSEQVAQRLETYDWPGNIRELHNLLEFAATASTGPEILPSDLPPWFNESGGIPSAAQLGVPSGLSYDVAVGLFEKTYLEGALKRFHWRVSRTAREIGMSKTTLLRRMHVLNLNSGI
jgi:two-component system NtrC family response regulator